MAFREEASREAENETGSGNCDESAGRVVVGKYRLEHVRWGINYTRNQLYEAGSRPRGQRDYKGKCSDIATHFPFAYGGMSKLSKSLIIRTRGLKVRNGVESKF